MKTSLLYVFFIVLLNWVVKAHAASYSLQECVGAYTLEFQWDRGERLFYEPAMQRGARGVIGVAEGWPEKYRSYFSEDLFNHESSDEIDGHAVSVFSHFLRKDKNVSFVTVIGNEDLFIYIMNKPYLFAGEFLDYCRSHSPD